MTARRPSFRPGRRLAWLMVLVGVLLARGLTPDGWMPVANAAGGIEIAVCNGSGPADALILTPDGKLHHKSPAKGQMGDHPCAFAGLGIADAAPPALDLPARLRPVGDAPVLATIGLLPGRGLAAPPPPATGPPARA